MSEGELHDSYIARLEAERDRLVAGLRATADWLDDLDRRLGFLLDEDDYDEFANRLADLRRLFLPPERFGDADPAMQQWYGDEEIGS